VTAGSDRRVEWRCARGHRWLASPKTRVMLGAEGGCRRCNSRNQSRVELRLWQLLASSFPDLVVDLGIEEVRWQRGHMARVDAALIGSKVALEYDGSYWHASRVEADRLKTRALLEAGWVVVRVREQPLVMLDMAHPSLVEIEWEGGSGIEQLRPLAEKLSRIIAARVRSSSQWRGVSAGSVVT
jgi:very-short-patch-repair endonuclease